MLAAEAPPQPHYHMVPDFLAAAPATAAYRKPLRVLQARTHVRPQHVASTSSPTGYEARKNAHTTIHEPQQLPHDAGSS